MEEALDLSFDRLLMMILMMMAQLTAIVSVDVMSGLVSAVQTVYCWN